MTFANGTKHYRQRCSVCYQGEYVSHEEGLKRLGKASELSKRRENKTRSFAKSPLFFKSREWQKLRYKTLLLYGAKCMCCGSKQDIHVDHIKPRSIYPELALDPDNLQILCESCNMGKGFSDETDFRNNAPIK